MRFGWLFALPCLLCGQLIPVGSPIPKGPNPPVVFLNGYQLSCSDSDFAGTFGKADQVLRASQIASVFFNNCAVAAQASGTPSIESLGIAFGQFLAGLRYTDGSPVSQVDIVAHSMGGLIVRSYLAGKLDITPVSWAPPANPGIRKAVFLATPNFGTPLAAMLGSDIQTREMSPGSEFLFDLNTWNEGLDDLRGVDALAIVGSGGTGSESGVAPGFDDGVASLTSASLSFIHPGRTRVVTACHASISLLVAFNFCSKDAPPIASIGDASNLVGQIMVSFLTGTNAWQSLGQAIEDNALGSTAGGINIQLQDPNGVPVPSTSALATTAAGPVNLTEAMSNAVAYSEALPAGVDIPIQLQTAGSPVTTTQKITAGTVTTAIVKPGPVIHGAVPAAGAVFPLDVAPGAFVAIYGSGLAGTTLTASGPNFPQQMGDVHVSVDGAPLAIQYVSPQQINVIWPDSTPGLTKLTVTNGSGSFTTNVIVQAAVPEVFTLDGGAAAAVNATSGTIVGPGAPLHAGVDYVELYLTGLGATTPVNGLDSAQIQPTVTVGGQPCEVTYAGRAPGEPGLDQINCRIPAGLAGLAIPVVVTSNGRTSNTVTLNIQSPLLNAGI